MKLALPLLFFPSSMGVLHSLFKSYSFLKIHRMTPFHKAAFISPMGNHLSFLFSGHLIAVSIIWVHFASSLKAGAVLHLSVHSPTGLNSRFWEL